MTYARIAFDQVLVILILIIIGIICYKINLINKQTNENLTNILLTLVTPILILVSFQQDITPSLLKNLIISFILAIITHFFSIGISYLLLRKKKRILVKENNKTMIRLVDNPDVSLERFTTIYSNAVFMGLPLISGMFGSEGVFYTTAFVAVWNILAWTHGVFLMDRTNKGGKLDFKEVIKKLSSPTIFAIIIGIILFLFQIKFPKPIYNAFEYISNLNTPLAMLIAGANIAQTNLLDTFKNLRIYYIAFIKLLLIPIALLAIYSLFPINEIVILTNIVLTACPSATMAILFATRYKQNSIYASEIFAVTTILSIITIPIVLYIAGIIL